MMYSLNCKHPTLDIDQITFSNIKNYNEDFNNMFELCNRIQKTYYYYCKINVCFVNNQHDLNILLDCIMKNLNIISISFCYCNILSNNKLYELFNYSNNKIENFNIYDNILHYDQIFNLFQILHGNIILKTISINIYKFDIDIDILSELIDEFIKKTYIKHINLIIKNNYNLSSIISIKIKDLFTNYPLEIREIPVKSNSKSANKNQ